MLANLRYMDVALKKLYNSTGLGPIENNILFDNGVS